MYHPHRAAIGVSCAWVLVLAWGCGPSPRPTEPVVATKDPFAATKAWNEKSQKIRDGIARALALTKQGHDLIGGPPMIGDDDREIAMEQLAPAWEKLDESQRMLDKAMLYSRIGFPEEYALLDSVRAINLHSLGFIKYLQRDDLHARALYLEGVEHADRAFTYLRDRTPVLWRYGGAVDTTALDALERHAAEVAALVAFELHARLAAYAVVRDKATRRGHQAKMDELEAWMRARKRGKAIPTITR